MKLMLLTLVVIALGWTESALVKKFPNQLDFNCIPNEIYKYQCNTCVCNDRGSAFYCTGLDCCKPGTIWQEECNTCHCGDDFIASCTEMACQ